MDRKKHCAAWDTTSNRWSTWARRDCPQPYSNPLEAALQAHELIKIKLGQNCPIERNKAGEELTKSTGAALVQIIGRMILLYRPNPDLPEGKRISPLVPAPESGKALRRIKRRGAESVDCALRNIAGRVHSPSGQEPLEREGGRKALPLPRSGRSHSGVTVEKTGGNQRSPRSNRSRRSSTNQWMNFSSPFWIKRSKSQGSFDNIFRQSLRIAYV